MPFPESDRAVFQKNPLVEVICQLRFPPILRIVAQAPSGFQESVRQSYPLYQKVDPVPWPNELAPILSGLLVQLGVEHVTHQFLTEDSVRFISLTQEFISLTERKYIHWDSFRAGLASAELVFRQAYQPAFYNRIGLRYQNRIDKDHLGLGDQGWHRLINPIFAGLLAASEIRDEVQETRSETLIRLSEIDGGSVRIRHGLIPDPGHKKLVYLFDADFFMEGRFTHDETFTTLGTFHRLAGNFFRWAITPDLAQALK